MCVSAVVGRGGDVVWPGAGGEEIERDVEPRGEITRSDSRAARDLRYAPSRYRWRDHPRSGAPRSGDVGVDDGAGFAVGAEIAGVFDGEDFGEPAPRSVHPALDGA